MPSSRSSSLTSDGAKAEPRQRAANENWQLSAPPAGAAALTAVARPAAPRPATSRLAATLRSPAALAAVAAMALVPVAARLPVARSLTLGVALQTIAALSALAAAWLINARFNETRRLRDLLMLAAVLTLAVTAISLRVLPAVLGVRDYRVFEAAQLCGRLAVGGLWLAAAMTPASRLVSRTRRAIWPVAGAALATLAAAFIGGALLSAQLVHLTGPHGGAAQFGQPLGVLLAVVTLGSFAVAALHLERRRWLGDPDSSIAPTAAGLALLAAAALYHLVLGPAVPGTVSFSQLPALTACGLILLAASRHEPEARARIAKAAALAERRRVARDLHDGLAQDLAFIAAHAPSMAADMGEDHPVVIAARRALAISRSTISDLSDPAGASAVESLEAIAHELRDQFDIAIAVDCQLQSDLAPIARQQVTRIAREAIANAARHGGARNVSVSLSRLELAVILRVVDDGRGIRDAEGNQAPEGFGLASMRERAAALGGYLTLHQPQRGGVELEVVFR